MRELMEGIADSLSSFGLDTARECFNQNPDLLPQNAREAFDGIYRVARQENIGRSEADIIETFMGRMGTGCIAPDNPMEYLVMGICCYVLSNIEIAAMFFAVAFLRTQNLLSFQFLNHSLLKMNAPETVIEYLALIEWAKPEIPNNLSMYYKRVARINFYHGKMELCDHYVQRMMGIRHFKRRKYRDVESCRLSKEDWEKFEADRKASFTPETDRAAHNNYDKWMHDSNKRQIACTVAELVYRNRLKSCLELGSHAGALIVLIRDLCRHWKYEVDFIGIEPDPLPFELSKSKLPGCELYLGDHRLLDTFGDRRFGIMLCSFICLLNREEVVDSILGFASRSCEYFVLVDDFSNATGDRPVIRRHYALHNWSRLLAKHGLDVMDRIFLEEPNEAANGIVISKNRA